MSHALHWPQYLVITWWVVATLSNTNRERIDIDRINIFFANVGAKGIAAFILWQGGFF